MELRNIVIMVKRNNYIVVIANTERFGREVMFEGNTFNQCFDYIKKELGTNKLRLTSSLIYEVYTDRDERSFPWLMHVEKGEK